MRAKASLRGRTAESRAFRSERVIEVAFELATEGGFEAVQMRAVASRADVALATLYRYFPSKIELIVAVIHGQLDALRADLLARPSRGVSMEARAVDVFVRAFRAMVRNKGWAHAAATAQLIPHAFTAETSPPPDPDGDNAMVQVVAFNVWGLDHPPGHSERIAIRMLVSLWISCVVFWLNGALTPVEVEQQLRYAAERLIPNGADTPPRA